MRIRITRANADDQKEGRRFEMGVTKSWIQESYLPNWQNDFDWRLA